LPDNAHRFPTNLSGIRSEFQVLCDDKGGPAPLWEGLDEWILERPCNQFPFDRTWDAYREWQPDPVKAMRHWPWVALAASQYRFERAQKQRYTDEPKPTELEA
jgi:hypothetical protein